MTQNFRTTSDLVGAFAPAEITSAQEGAAVPDTVPLYFQASEYLEKIYAFLGDDAKAVIPQLKFEPEQGKAMLSGLQFSKNEQLKETAEKAWNKLNGIMPAEIKSASVEGGFSGHSIRFMVNRIPATSIALAG